MVPRGNALNLDARRVTHDAGPARTKGKTTFLESDLAGIAGFQKGCVSGGRPRLPFQGGPRNQEEKAPLLLRMGASCPPPQLPPPPNRFYHQPDLFPFKIPFPCAFFPLHQHRHTEVNPEGYSQDSNLPHPIPLK